MRAIRFLLLAVILVAIVVLALANRDPITLHLMPPGMDGVVQQSIDLPLFVIILGAVLVGMVVGYLFEWLREHKHRRRASQKTQEAARLTREVSRLRQETNRPEDDVLALLGR